MLSPPLIVLKGEKEILLPSKEGSNRHRLALSDPRLLVGFFIISPLSHFVNILSRENGSFLLQKWGKNRQKTRLILCFSAVKNVVKIRVKGSVFNGFQALFRRGTNSAVTVGVRD